MPLRTVTIPIITSVVTFIVYALLGHTITPAVAFTVVSLFQIVRNPFGQIRKMMVLSRFVRACRR